ncbi:NMT [Lepeophtheirus salmonis]|uniref:Glycylpeptide N-tetradecanoyltransferase n=1 Tax=Lepeophtheirus salmonis TaxID=72036 RepID=A0A7R8D4Y7_LEPSM|nr:glycylpeptide N-tetradecanoyltransferase 2-like [Lepeophtheirus salmonis]CAB4069606.1 NMT [Lepeophtheirus salmonis]CAF3030159.1 NMT [Lepeophtheirus salmonis]
MDKSPGKENDSKSSSKKNAAKADESLNQEQLITLKKAFERMKMESSGPSAPKNVEEAVKKNYDFWKTQPVPKIDEEIPNGTNEAICADVPIEKVRQEPYSLPEGFHWDTLNIDDPLVLKELYVLLNENYVEDDDNMFRFDYSPEFLRWALQPPGSVKDWHTGVRATKTKKLVGFISAIPAHIHIYNKEKRIVEINFLCVHKKLRSKRLAPVLIREITRRVNIRGIFQAVYTAGVILPKPIGTCRYWHRSLNPKKLIEVKFSHLSRNMTMQRLLKLYKLPDDTKTSGLRKLRASDIKETCALLNKFLSNYDISQIFNEDEFRHWFLPREDIVSCFVVEKEGKITDMLSYYTLSSTVMSHPVHSNVKAAYSFYNVSSETPWADLMGDALILAKKDSFDVFNALDLMENAEFLQKLKFGIGDGNLHYYMYNWRCPIMQPNKVGLVLQ